MAQIYTQNPGSTEIQSPLIAGITEALGKISSVLNLETKTIEDLQLQAVTIDNSDENKNRIYEASSGNRLWLTDPAPVFKKNGVKILQDTEQFTVDYVGGSITFPEEKKPSDGDKITVSATCIIATSETIDAINSLLNSVKENSDKYKGNYDSLSALQLAHSSAKNGDFAIVFDPLAVYAWKNDGWYDTRSIEDLSNYYQKQETDELLDKKENAINPNGSSATDDNYYYGGRKTWQDLFAKVRSVTLTGLSTASDAVVTASDTILSAIGKLQAQVSKATEKAYLSGTGEPTTSTKGVVGQRYVNTSNGDIYTCISASDSTYIWSLRVKRINGKTPAAGGEVTLSASDIGAATSSQGVKADSAMQPSVYDTNGKNEDIFQYTDKKTAQATSSTLGTTKISDSYDGTKSASGGWSASPLALKKVSQDIYMVRTYAKYSSSTPRLLSVVITLPDGISAGINQFGVCVEVENEMDSTYQRFIQISNNNATVYFRKQDGSNFQNGNVVWFSALVVVNR